MIILHGNVCSNGRLVDCEGMGGCGGQIYALLNAAKYFEPALIGRIEGLGGKPEGSRSHRRKNPRGREY